jgi:ABC-2 type transport system ATP-binding protein
MPEEVVIRAEHVFKDFVLPHEKVSTLKGAFTNIAKAKGKKRNETQHALKDVSFEVREGEFFGIVGRNGSGKSTMLKLLAGIYQPNKGSVATSGKVVPFIELGVGFNPELSGKDNVYLNGALFGFSKAEVDAMYDEVVAFAELGRFMDQKLKNYSSGMQVRLAFSLAIKAQADILLIDEVLAVGDTAFQQKCLNYFFELKANKKTVVFVSHDMDAVEQFCDRAVLIDDAKLVLEGTAHEAAIKYRKMFAKEVTGNGSEAKSSKRFGDKAASFTSYKLTQHPDTVTIEVTLQYEHDLKDVVCGFSIAGNAQHIVGTNTHVEGIDLQTHANDSHQLSLAWTMPNIFANGSYVVTLGLNTPSRSLTHDWIDEALRFTVLKEYTTSHLVEPAITLNIEGA